MFLSSTTRFVELIFVVVPFTVKFPDMVRLTAVASPVNAGAASGALRPSAVSSPEILDVAMAAAELMSASTIVSFAILADVTAPSAIFPVVTARSLIFPVSTAKF